MSVVTFPLSVADFFGMVRVVSAEFSAPENAVASITGGGEVLSAFVAPQLWRGSIQAVVDYHSGAAGLEALADLLRRPGASFLVHDPRFTGPQGDPDGTRLGSAAPALLSVNADNRRLALQGLPSGYRLQRGDYLGFTYAGIRALHRVVASEAVALSNGQTPQFEVTPLIRAGAAPGQAVQLVRPVVKAKLVPGSLNVGRGRLIFTDGISFDWVQTLK